MRIDIDQRRCCGYRLCVETAPNIFLINTVGKAYVAVDTIPEQEHNPVTEAARECPSAAITVHHDESAGA